MLSVVYCYALLNVILLSVVMLSVIMLSVVTPLIINTACIVLITSSHSSLRLVIKKHFGLVIYRKRTDYVLSVCH
jgi:hypothetical protein